MSISVWRDRDWYWVFGILISIIILMIAWFFNSEKVELNFSIISSAVSIALALVAIFISVKQDSNSQNIYSRINEAVIKIEGKIETVDSKLDKMDAKVVTEPFEEKMKSELENIIKSSNNEEEKVDKMVKSINENFGIINQNLNSVIKTNKNNRTKYRGLNSFIINLNEKGYEDINKVLSVINKINKIDNSTAYVSPYNKSYLLKITTTLTEKELNRIFSEEGLPMF